MLALMRRPDGNPAPLLVLQHAVGSFGRELCISYELDPGRGLVCDDTPGAGTARRRRPQRDLRGRAARRGRDLRGRGIDGGLRIRATGPGTPDLGRQHAQRPGDPTGPGECRVGRDGGPRRRRRPRCARRPASEQPERSGRRRSITSFGTRQAAVASSRCRTPCPRRRAWTRWPSRTWTRTGCNDVVAAGIYGTGMVHLGTGRAASTVARTCHRSATRTRPPPRG